MSELVFLIPVTVSPLSRSVVGNVPGSHPDTAVNFGLSKPDRRRKVQVREFF